MSNRRYITILFSVLFIVLVFSSYQMLSGITPEEKVPVSVIVSDSTNDRWNAMREGMEQAALNYQISLNIISTENLSSAKDLISLMRREIELGAKGIVFEPVDDRGMVEFIEEVGRSVSLVLIQSDIEPGDVYSSVLTDDATLISQLTTALEEKYGEKLMEKKIGIVQSVPYQFALKQRKKLLEDYFREKEISLSWRKNNIYFLSDLVEQDPVDIIIALDNISTEATIDSLLELKKEKKTDLFGIGYSEKAVYYLDRQVVDHLVLNNDFNMGYMSIENIRKMIDYGNQKTNQRIDSYSIGEENMYEEEYQKILFPLVQ